jgi:Rhodopirellula transposase DDE domain
MADATAGDPVSGLKWTHKSLRKISAELARRHKAASAPTVARLLRADGYSQRVNHKRHSGKRPSAARDEQFGYISRQKAAHARRREPVISVDTKKKELIGEFRASGAEWRQERREVLMYDFPGDARGKAIPYGIYDVARNTGYVSLGISHDTPLFAVEAIRRWWLDEGRASYPTATRLLIGADCGGSNGNRTGLWLVGLQEFADEFGVAVTVTHYPSGASKWNPVEHRMFSLISRNWAGQPLVSYETALKHIRTTTSTTGFRCVARLDRHAYELGLKATPEELAGLRLRRHRRFPDWNYTISPRISSKSPT